VSGNAIKIDRNVVASRLGIDPNRLRLDVDTGDGEIVRIDVLVDGRDLTLMQSAVVIGYLREIGIAVTTAGSA